VRKRLVIAAVCILAYRFCIQFLKVTKQPTHLLPLCWLDAKPPAIGANAAVRAASAIRGSSPSAKALDPCLIRLVDL
jgi:hypothetical protein